MPSTTHSEPSRRTTKSSRSGSATASSGESAVWFGMALRKTGGKLITHEIDPKMVKVAEENFKKVGLDDLITVIEGDAHGRRFIPSLLQDNPSLDQTEYLRSLELLDPLTRQRLL